MDRIVRTAEDLEKEGVFTGRYCVNPLTGREMPIYVANFVLMGYGTGAVMAVPAHDQRDFEFAAKYDLPRQIVIMPREGALELSSMTEAFTEPGVMANSGKFDGMDSEAAKQAIHSPMLESAVIDGAKGILVNFTASREIRMVEVHEAMEYISKNANPEAIVKYGQAFDDTLGDELKITVIATGFSIGKTM